MKGFILTPRAKQDVNHIWDYIADDNIEAADRVLDALETAMVKLAKNPGIGHWREELTDKRHRLTFWSIPSRCRLCVCSMPPATCKASLVWRPMSRSGLCPFTRRSRDDYVFGTGSGTAGTCPRL